MQVAPTSLDLHEAPSKAVSEGRGRGGGGRGGAEGRAARGRREEQGGAERRGAGSPEGRKEENRREDEEGARRERARGEGKVTAGISEGPVVRVLSAP